MKFLGYSLILKSKALGFFLGFLTATSFMLANLVYAEVKNEDKFLSTADGSSEAYGYDIAAEDTTLVVGEIGDNGSGFYSGAAYVYHSDEAGEYNETKLTASDGAINGRFGWSVDIENGVIVVSATGASGTGAVYVYRPDGIGGYNETKILPSDGNVADYFGHSVAISDGVIVVGSPYHKVNGVRSGIIYVYKPNGTGGYTETKVIPPSITFGYFGYSVDIHEGIIVVGDWTRNSNAGRAYVYKPNTDSYTVSTLLASDGVAGDYFGQSVAIRNNVIVVGALNEDGLFADTGAVYVYSPIISGGYTETKLTASDGRYAGHLGFDVNLSEDGTVISSVVRDGVDSKGSAYVFKLKNLNNYTELKLAPTGGYQDDRFGYAVAITQNQAIVAWPANEAVLLFNISDVVQTNLAPELNHIGNQTVSEGDTLTFTISATDPDSDTITFSATNLPPGATFTQSTGLFTWNTGFDDAGNYPDIEFTATDNGTPLELDLELITITVGDVNRMPELTNPGPQTVVEDDSVTFSVSATDPDNNTVTLSASNLPDGATWSGTAFSWNTDRFDAGTYVVTFIATDDGTPAESASLDVVITVGDNPTPTEQAEDLIEDIITLDIPQNVENSYLANLQKVEQFILEGKITAALNQLQAFKNKVNQDYSQGILTQAERDELIAAANQLISDLSN